jgi:hypothetical protein
MSPCVPVRLMLIDPPEMRWGFGLPVKEIAMPFEQIKHHYFLDLWADMCTGPMELFAALTDNDWFRDVHILCRTLQIRYPRFLLEDVLPIEDTTADSDPLRSVSWLDHRKGASTYLQAETLTNRSRLPSSLCSASLSASSGMKKYQAHVR